MVRYETFCVQRGEPPTTYLGTNDEDAYWKLKFHGHATIKDLQAMLVERNFYCQKSITKDQAIEFLHRLERGLISYWGCSSQELQRFVKDRRLTTISSGKRSNLSKRDYVHALEDADDARKFPKFMELAAELRVRIYNMLFEGMDMSKGPRQPPLTQISRQVRQEALSVFYSLSTFIINIWPGDNSSVYMDCGALKPMTEEGLLRVMAVDIQLLCPTTLPWPPFVTFRTTGARWEVRPSRGVTPKAVVVLDESSTQEARKRVGAGAQEWLDARTQLLQLVMSNNVSIHGIAKLRKQDIAAIKGIISGRLRKRAN